MDGFAILQRYNAQELGFSGFRQIDAIPMADAAVGLNRSRNRIEQGCLDTFGLEISALAQNLLHKIARCLQLPTLTNESNTRLRPALSKSISSLLPSISAMMP